MFRKQWQVWVACCVVLSVGVGVGINLDPRVPATAQSNDFDEEFLMAIEDELGLQCFRSALLGLESYITSELQTRRLRRLAFELVSGSGGAGDSNVYGGDLGFSGSGSPTVMAYSYDYDPSSQGSPSVPPDTLSSNNVIPPPAPGWAGTIIADETSFYALLYVLDQSNLPQAVLNEFPSRDLEKVWVEQVGATSEQYRVYFQFTGPATVIAECSHTGSGQFGTITVL